MEQLVESNYNFAKEIIYCGIGQHESVLHFGACDTGLNLLKQLDEFQIDIKYTAVDINEEVNTLFSDFESVERTHQWTTVNTSMQEYIDEVEVEKYSWTVITGVFDKPKYSERQYQFIDTVVSKCINFSDNVLFSINEKSSALFKYSMIYLYSHFTNKYDKVTVKKIEDSKYIFHISK